MPTKNLNVFYPLFGVCVALAAFASLLVQPALAQQPTLVLTINGAQSANIIDGEEVDIEWYLDGKLKNCALSRNGSVIRAIDTTSPPVNGSLTEVPPTGSNTNYSMSCNGISDSVSVAINPIVSLSLPQGQSRTNDLKTGELDYVDVNWESQYATECSNVWMEQDNPYRFYTANNGSEYGNKNKPDGQERFWSNSYLSINRTTTFYITCTNSITGGSATESITLTVNDPPPPEPPIVNLWTNTPFVSPDPLYRYAKADVRFNSSGVSDCFYKAYYEDGREYSSLPSGFGQGQDSESGTFDIIRILETTDFEVRCTRDSVTLNNVVYPATSTKSVVRVVVDASGATVDRSTLPPVTAFATVTPNPAVKNAISGEALINIETDVQNADYCYQYAYRFNNDTGQYDDRYDLYGWSRMYSYNRRGNGPRDYSAFISESTRLELSCRREYDYDETNPGADYENGVELTSIVVIAEEPESAAAPVKTYLYGNSFFASAEDIWSNRVGPTTFYRNRSWIQAQNNARNEITFPFKHPFGSSGVYNIHVDYYDENDGEATFRLFSQANGLLATWTSNDPLSPSNIPNATTRKTVLVATGVTLTDGDLITLECTTPQDDEYCRTEGIYFGSGNGSSVTVPLEEANGFTTVPLLWVGENATKCTNAVATVQGVGSYPWYFGNSTLGLKEIDLATTTTFTIECSRNTDSSKDTGTVEVRFPTSVALEAEILVASGECINPTTLINGDAPDGFIANTTVDRDSDQYGLCIPAVDLAAASPSFSRGAENNVDGTYDTVDTLMVIRNLGPGDLPSGKEIAYMGRMTFQPVYALPTRDTLVGKFNGSITAAEIESPTLTRTFTDVPFGTHTVCSRVNLDNSPNNYPEASTNFANNQTCTTITLPVPRPPMTLTASRDVIRSGQTVDIDWGVNVTYELQCTVQGAGGLSESFNTLLTGSGHSDSFTTNPLTSTSEFIFQCTEPITGTTFTENTTVEVVPDFEEI